MSSTNVHSKDVETSNFYCVGGQTIANEKGEITIPPKAAKKIDITMDSIMEIEAHDGELGKDGILRENGKKVAQFGTEAFSEIASKKNKETTRASEGEAR